jgi:hypothetical protein
VVYSLVLKLVLSQALNPASPQSIGDFLIPLKLYIESYLSKLNRDCFMLCLRSRFSSSAWAW